MNSEEWDNFEDCDIIYWQFQCTGNDKNIDNNQVYSRLIWNIVNMK